MKGLVDVGAKIKEWERQVSEHERLLDELRFKIKVAREMVGDSLVVLPAVGHKQRTLIYDVSDTGAGLTKTILGILDHQANKFFSVSEIVDELQKIKFESKGDLKNTVFTTMNKLRKRGKVRLKPEGGKNKYAAIEK